jgi:hypothetical protein
MTALAPLTTPECDLRDYPWMPVDCARLLTSETWILGTADQKVAAFTLWAKSWHQVPAGSLPDNDRVLAALSEAGAKWAKVREHALRGWVKCSDGRLYHPVVAEKAVEAWRLKLAQRARTEAARAAKSAKRGGPTDDPKPTVAPSVTEPVTDAVTGSNRQYQTRPDLKEERKNEGDSVSPRVADTERASPEAAPEPSWPPPLHPSAITSRVEQVAIKLQGKARGQAFLTARGPVRSVDEQIAAVAPPKVKPNHARPEVLAEARARLRGNG